MTASSGTLTRPAWPSLSKPSLSHVPANFRGEPFDKLREVGTSHPRPRYVATPWSGTHNPSGTTPDCQNTSIGMPPRGYQ